METAIGQVFDGRYRIEARLGNGAMGTVFRATHLKISREFAIKVLHSQLTTNAKFRRRFEREAEIAAQLRHQNTVGVIDVGETSAGELYIIMEYASGPTLASMLGTGPLPRAQVVHFARQLCDGLQHAHDLGLIHRDFKPENVIVEPNRAGEPDTVRIVDFGIALQQDEAPTRRERLTTEGVVLGTPHYMAPEHARGQAIDHRIDLFALGVICFEMLTGKMPFDGDGVDVARANIMFDTPPMGVRVPFLDVDPLLEMFTRKLMARSRDERPLTAKAARELLDLIERDRPAAAHALGLQLPATLLDPAPVYERSRPMQVMPAVTRQSTEPGVLFSAAMPIVDPALPVTRSRRGLAVIAAAAAGILLAIVGVGTIGSAMSSDGEPIAGRQAITAPAPSPRAAVRVDRPPPPSPESARTPPARIASAPALAAPVVVATPPPRSVSPAPKQITVKPAKQVATIAVVSTVPAELTATAVAQQYAQVGRALGRLQDTRGQDATIELWPRFRYIRIQEAIASPESRRETARLLAEIDRDIKSALAR